LTSGYPLEELFLTLRRHGFALDSRDYQDALAALAAGFGVGSRAELLRVLDALWARTEAESRALALLAEEIPAPSAQEISEYDDARKADGATVRSPQPAERPLQPPVEAPEGERPVAVTFNAPDQSGFAIPQPFFSPSHDEAFILTPQLPVTLRSLIVAWRRFQLRQKSGPGRELDVPASIDRQCRVGRLLSPVLKPQRANQARLLLLIDCSSSMAAWSSLTPLWQESIAQGRLGAASICYFSNVPREALYLNPSLRDPLDVEDTLRAHRESALLIFSDAGAARGGRNRDRIQHTKQFLDRARGQSSSMAWVNPLPSQRWRGTSAEAIARQCRVPMLPLSEADMVRAVDLLRGVRTAFRTA
jgi:uncharacterized protein